MENVSIGERLSSLGSSFPLLSTLPPSLTDRSFLLPVSFLRSRSIRSRCYFLLPSVENLPCPG